MSEEKKEDLILKRFGRYLLLDHLVDGGMAKICRARFLGETADKIVAIKMIQPQYSANDSFKNMFMNEIKVAFALIHPNIAQTYDYGMENQQLFTAMEYVDGKNLKEFLDKLKTKKFVFPVEISVHIIAQAALALHYAHTLLDKLTGKPYSIIHRDISPHNIMITYDGAVKVIDFGIAKSNTNSEATQAGTIKGKLSYLAPEYLEGKALDCRYDEFGLAITLWEMLCGRKLFKAANDLAVLKLIQSCKIPPPSAINPNVPKELDAIVMKSLSRDRSLRYPNLDQFNRALIKFLYSTYPEFNATDLSYFAKELFKEEIKKEKEKFFEFGKVDLRPFLDDIQRGIKKPEDYTQNTNTANTAPQGAAADAVFVKDSNDRKGGRKAQIIDFGFEQNDPRGKKNTKNVSANVRAPKEAEDGTGPSLTDTVKRDNGTKVGAVGGDKQSKTGVFRKKETQLLVIKGSTGAGGSRDMSYRTTNGAPRRRPRDEDARSSGGNYKAGMIIMIIGLVAYWSYNNFYISKEKENPVAVVDHSNGRKTASVPMGKIIITNFEKQTQKIFINGEQADVSVVGQIDHPLTKEPLRLRVESPGLKHYFTTIGLGEQNPILKLEIPQMPTQSYGLLVDNRKCEAGKIYFELFGESRVEPIPMQNGKTLSIPVGDFQIYFQKEGNKVKREINFTIKREDDTVEFCDILKS
ncbi:MAG: serine/threonine-protein kinase [Pseudomonadota bacterium]